MEIVKGMLNSKRSVLLMAAVITASGCATRYTQPDSGAVAELTVEHKTETYGSWTTVTAFDNARCEHTSGFGRIGQVGKAIDVSGKPATRTIQAAEEIFLAVQGVSNKTEYGKHVRTTCINLLSFTPEPNGRYFVYQKAGFFGKCNAIVVDAASGEMAKSLKIHKATGECQNHKF